MYMAAVQKGLSWKQWVPGCGHCCRAASAVGNSIMLPIHIGIVDEYLMAPEKSFRLPLVG